MLAVANSPEFRDKSPHQIVAILYLFLDVWSRKIVGWDVHEREDDALAAGLLSRMASKIGSLAGLVLHADNGGRCAAG